MYFANINTKALLLYISFSVVASQKYTFSSSGGNQNASRYVVYLDREQNSNASDETVVPRAFNTSWENQVTEPAANMASTPTPNISPSPIDAELEQFGMRDYKRVRKMLKRYRQMALTALGNQTGHSSAGQCSDCIANDETEVYANRHVLDDLFESDIVLTRSQARQILRLNHVRRRTKRTVVTLNRWDPNNIPYTFRSCINGSTRATIREAMKHWEQKTCFKFRENGAGDSIVFFKGSGCYSSVGRIGVPRQPISIGSGCETRGIVVHEIGHALGFWHAHNRPERDNYVQILWGNIQNRTIDKFLKQTTSEVTDYGVPYDYLSIMHYGQRDFSKNGKITIRALDRNFQGKMGQRTALSAADIIQMNKAYNCKATVKSRTPKPKPPPSPPQPKPSKHLWSRFIFQRGTALPETDANFKFLLASNRDVFAIKMRGARSTEVHVLSANSNYGRFSMHTATGLHPTDPNNWDFGLASNRDLFCISKKGGSGTTEVHVLSAKSNYQQFVLHTATALHQTGANFEFAVGANRDVYVFKKSATGTKSTEVHVLSTRRGYKNYSLHTGTKLHETNGDWEMLLHPTSNDLVGVARKGRTGTELHVLGASNNYNSFKYQSPTAWHKSNHNHQFMMASNWDLFVVKQQGTGSRKTEIHVIRKG